MAGRTLIQTMFLKTADSQAIWIEGKNEAKSFLAAQTAQVFEVLERKTLGNMSGFALSPPLLALLSVYFCVPVLSSVHTLYTSNFHNGSELYTLQFNDENLEFNQVDSAPADGPMVWLDFDVSTSGHSLKRGWERELNTQRGSSTQEVFYTASHSKRQIFRATTFCPTGASAPPRS